MKFRSLLAPATFLVCCIASSGSFAENEFEKINNRVFKPTWDGVYHFAKELDKEKNKLGKSIEKRCAKVGAGIEHFLDQACLEICKIGCGRDYDPKKDGPCTCGCSGEVVADQDGNVYSRSPDTGEVVGGSKKPAEQLSPQDFKSFVAFQQSMEFWHYEITPKTVFGMNRTMKELVEQGFLPPKFIAWRVPGEAWPGGPKAVTSPTKSGEIRGPGPEGSGYFFSPRDGGVRLHGSFDYLTQPGEKIYSPIDGTIELVGVAKSKVSKDGKEEIVALHYVEIRAPKGNHFVRIHYVNLNPQLQARLEERNRNPKDLKPPPIPIYMGGEIGQAENIHVIYPPTVPPHLHLEFWEGRPKRKLSSKISVQDDVILRKPEQKKEKGVKK